MAVVSVTEFLTDGTRNVMPTTVRIKGDCRSYRTDVSARIEAEMHRVAEAVTAGFAATAEISYARAFIPTINAPEQAEAALRVARSVLGYAAVDGDCDPVMASEDFVRLLAHVPGCFVFLGNGAPGSPGAVRLHNPGYDFSDAALPYGVAYFRALARDRLPAS